MRQRWRQAQSLQCDAAAEGFDWPDLQGVFAKLREEVDELEAAATGDATRRSEEFGDVLFVLARLAQKLDVDAEDALDAVCERFRQRFAHVMADADSLPPPGSAERLVAMEARWQQAKRREPKS